MIDKVIMAYIECDRCLFVRFVNIISVWFVDILFI